MTTLTKPVRRIAATPLGNGFGSDSTRRITITLIPGNGDDVPDSIELRPLRTKRGERGNVDDLYRYLVRCRVNRELLEKARERKAKKAVRLAGERQARAEKRLVSDL